MSIEPAASEPGQSIPTLTSSCTSGSSLPPTHQPPALSYPYYGAYSLPQPSPQPSSHYPAPSDPYAYFSSYPQNYGHSYGYPYPVSAVPQSTNPLPNPFSLPPPPLASKGREERSSRRDQRRYSDKRRPVDTYSHWPGDARSSSYSGSRRHSQDGQSRRSRSPIYSRRTSSRSPPPLRPPSSGRKSLKNPSHSRSSSPVSRSVPKKQRRDLVPLDKKKAFLEKRIEMNDKEIIEQEKRVWIRSAPADLYYQRDLEKPLMMRATDKLEKLCDKFYECCIKRPEDARKEYPIYKRPVQKRIVKKCAHHHSSMHHHDCSDSSSDSDDESSAELPRDEAINWLEHRQSQPFRLDKEIWDNQPGELNDGPSCRCSSKAKKIGIRHGIYQGEDKKYDLDLSTNNFNKIYHYRVTISPPTNFLSPNPTVIEHDGHEFVFEGFSLFTPVPLQDLPPCTVLRFNIKYSILYFEEKVPDNFTLRELKLFHQYFFQELLELLDWDINERFYFMPRFVRELSEDGKEILSMNEVIKYLIESYKPLIEEIELNNLLQMSSSEWLDFTDQIKGMIVTHPGKKPAAIRVDQIDREQEDGHDTIKYPDIVHFGSRPAQMCYAGNSDYQKTWREFVKYRHLLANMPKPSFADKRNLESLESKLFNMRSNSNMKKDVTVAMSSQGFFKTGLMSDIVQHGMLLPVLVNHLRLHASLEHFEEKIGYKFKNRYLLQLAITHPSYKENYGTNPDHARNTLSNCGVRQPEYGDKKIHFQSSRKRGINMLIKIMSRFGKKRETESNVQHNERLEFLGDAVVEFITSVHLFYMFTDIEEGGLATYRAALVQNQHLAILAEVLGLEHYMLYAHGSDLCHDAELRHAMANCFESVMGAVFLDGGINEADRIFGQALFGSDKELFNTWTKLSHHPLQLQEPEGDRHWITTYPLLQKLTKFEEMTGIEFKHIRLLARAFTDRSMGITNLTLGSNQRMEFLGDTVLQLVTSDFLYRHFPEHHEGHLSLLRSSIVNNRTQSVVCDDLGMAEYATFFNPKHELKTKDKADLLEAFLGALYIDKDLRFCQKFAEVCFFPRLNQFIVNQEWNDPKSKLQQCCLTLRTMHGKEPDIPIYKVTESKGPTNTRVYGVVVYFRDERLAKAEGHSIQEAEMNAAKKALESCQDLFPHLNYQKKIVERSFQKQNKDQKISDWQEEVRQKRKELGLDDIYQKESEQRDKVLHAKDIIQLKNNQKRKRLNAEHSDYRKTQPKKKKTTSSAKAISSKIVQLEQEKEEGECSDDEPRDAVIQDQPNAALKYLAQEYDNISSPEF